MPSEPHETGEVPAAAGPAAPAMFVMVRAWVMLGGCGSPRHTVSFFFSEFFRFILRHQFLTHLLRKGGRAAGGGANQNS